MDRYISAAEAAEMLKLNVTSLATLRSKGMGLRFYKPTPRKVLYKYSEVIDWIENSAQYATKDERENNENR
jgi:phage terminase Nu1 subunit (DNA packaging protein)